jgi:predicted O-methyltransferase YrrM
VTSGRPGFFIPHRHAGDVRAPAGYAALDAIFASAASDFLTGLSSIAAYLPALLGLGGAPPAPRFEQDWFPRLDAAFAYAAVRTRKPPRIVEIGSGHSTRFMARAVADDGLATQLTAIDPAPRAALRGLKIEWIQATLQAAGPRHFSSLRHGDVLFVDSSHILMPGTDVDLVLNEILPRLPAGVLVHFHDIFLPDAYPESWTWRGYNEQNAVALLLSAGRWRLLWSSRFVATRMGSELAASGIDRLKLMPGAFESSLWLEKL